jgi:hypothetical protein
LFTRIYPADSRPLAEVLEAVCAPAGGTAPLIRSTFTIEGSLTWHAAE